MDFSYTPKVQELQARLLPLLKDTEVDHIDWLEQQLGLIKELGLPLYLAQQR